MSRILKNYQILEGEPYEIKFGNFRVLKGYGDLREASETKSETSAAAENGAAAVHEDVTLIEPDAGLKGQELIREAMMQAENIIADAKAKAAGFIEEARNQAKEEYSQILEQAKQEGFEAGMNEGRKAGHQEFAQLIAEASELKRQINSERQAFYDEAEGQVVQAVIDIARKVLSDEIVSHPQYILQLARKALSKCSEKDMVTLRVSPSDEEFLSEHRQELLNTLEGLGKLEIQADPGLERGSCIVDTPYGSINAGVDTQLDGIEDLFTRILFENRSAASQALNEKGKK